MRLPRRWLVAVVAVAGLLSRWWVLSTPWGTLNADEAVTGLGAIDAIHGRFDIVVPGNAYTANLESYLLAPFVAVFGAHVTPLKLMPVVLWGAACLVLALLARRLIGTTAALVTGALLWLAPGSLLVLSTRAYLAYAGGLLWVALSLLLLVSVVEADEPTARQSAVAGLFVGLAVYAHPMYLAVVLPACAMVGVTHLRRLRTWWIPAGGVALAVNVPWIVWNMRHGFPSLAGEVVDDSRGTYSVRLGRFFSGLLPRDLGLLDQGGTRWLFGRPISTAVYLAVLAVVAVGAGRLARSSRGGRLVAVCLVAVWPVMAVFSPLGFVLDGRYGIVPAPLLFLAFGAGVVTIARSAAGRRREIEPVLCAVAVAAWAAFLVLPFQWRVIGRRFVDPNAQESAVVELLDSRGIGAVAGSYWAVIPVTYLTDGRIPSAVTAGFPIRYPHYQRLVQSADPTTVAFVFQPTDDNPGALWMPLDRYERVDVQGLVAYVPKAAG